MATMLKLPLDNSYLPRAEKLMRQAGVHVLKVRDVWSVLGKHNESDWPFLLDCLKRTQPGWFGR